MKRIIIIALALLAALALSGCNDTLNVTSPDLGDYYAQWAPERTSIGFSSSDYFDTVTFSGALSAAPLQNELSVSFTLVPESVDILKYKTLEEFGPALKAALHFYNYTDKGDVAKLIPPKLASSPLNYDVIKWEGKIATIKFTNLTTTLSDQLEVRFDPDKYTHHDGLKLDLNNDGVVDNYDLLYWGRRALAGTTNTGFAACVEYDPQWGLISGNSSTGIVGTNPAYFSIFIRNDLVVNSLDKTDYTDTFNNIFKMQKFDLSQRKWVDTGVKGTYKVADGEFRFTINKPNEFEQFRMILANYNAALQFSTSGEFFGFKQRIYGGDLGAWNNVVLEWLTPIEDWAKFVPFNPFTVNTITHDGNDRNVIVNVALDVGGAISADGLPDPKDAIEKGQILLGFSYDYYNLSSNQYEWNTLNFMPITIEPYKSNSTKTVNDMWRIILPPYYAYAPSNATKYLFITPDYKDKGTPALSFGNPYNILFTYEGNIQYEIYELSDTF